MKITSFRAVEAYIYSTLILPLKRLDIERLDITSPIRDAENEWSLGLYQAELTTRFRRNYQRERARRERNWYIGLRTGTGLYVIGEYQLSNRWVKLYEEPFRELKAMPLLGKMFEMFDRDSQFSKVVIKVDSPYPTPQDAFREFDARRMPVLERNEPPVSRSMGIENPHRAYRTAAYDVSPYAFDEDDDPEWD